MYNPNEFFIYMYQKIAVNLASKKVFLWCSRALERLARFIFHSCHWHRRLCFTICREGNYCGFFPRRGLYRIFHLIVEWILTPGPAPISVSVPSLSPLIYMYIFIWMLSLLRYFSIRKNTNMLPFTYPMREIVLIVIIILSVPPHSRIFLYYFFGINGPSMVHVVCQK